MICVYPPDCADFSNNGLGVVRPLSCTVTETLNGEWELTLVHPIDEDNRWSRLSEGYILRAPVPAAVPAALGVYALTRFEVGRPLFWAFVNISVSGALFAVSYIVITRRCAPGLLAPLLTPLPASLRRRILPASPEKEPKTE